MTSDTITKVVYKPDSQSTQEFSIIIDDLEEVRIFPAFLARDPFPIN